MAAAFWRGLKSATSIILGYLPVGFAYGVPAEKSGLSLFNTVAMSVLVLRRRCRRGGAGLHYLAGKS